MILQNKPGATAPEGTDTPAPEAGQTAHKRKSDPIITPAAFFAGLTVESPGAVQGVVFAGRGGAPNDHLWNTGGQPYGGWAAVKAKGRKPAYFTCAAFASSAVERFKGRTASNAQAIQSFWFDIEGSAEKYQKNPDGGYPDAKATGAAVGAFIKATGLKPNFIVLTGSGGMHLYFGLTAPLTPDQWKPRARQLVALANQQGLKVDVQCTTDPARIMRAPGSIHQKTGAEVTAVQLRGDRYELAEWDRRTGYVPGTNPPDAITHAPSGRYDLSINDDLTGSYPAFSYRQAAQRCGAMNRAAQQNGQDTPYPIWILAAKTADLSTEGRGFAHEISCGHADYDEATTDKKIDSLTGGPAGCDAWANAYGPGGPCDGCEFRGDLKNPAVQLGALANTTPPGATTDTAPADTPEWVSELNRRFALVRHGSKMAVVDFQTPTMSGRGLVMGLGLLDAVGLRTMLNGRFAPVQRAGERQRGVADAWLAHPARRQYEGLVFSPGEPLPANILNLWQGFAVEPRAGDVSPWLDVLAALVPSEADRSYVLRWLAWKIQHPGGVPDTILIFKGAKGTGKNSLFDPLILLFGRHAMLADDPELIAGRFTGHLMSLAFAVLDEAVFIQDPKQADHIKSRVTAKTKQYEQKGMDPVQGVNRCAYVMLTNHEYVWQATSDERRAVVIEVGEALRGRLQFWERYHAWAAGDGPAALLHYLQGVDLTGFNPREIPKGEALRKQIEQTALRSPAVAWWHTCLTEGAIRWRDNGIDRVMHLNPEGDTEIDRASLRQSYEQSAGARGRSGSDWSVTSKRLNAWAGAGGMRKVRARTDTGRAWLEVLPPLPVLREAFTQATSVQVTE